MFSLYIPKKYFIFALEHRKVPTSNEFRENIIVRCIPCLVFQDSLISLHYTHNKYRHKMSENML